MFELKHLEHKFGKNELYYPLSPLHSLLHPWDASSQVEESVMNFSVVVTTDNVFVGLFLSVICGHVRIMIQNLIYDDDFS